MQRFKNIMYVCDEKGGESEALHRAITLAINNSARLKVVEVYEDVPQEMLELFDIKKFPDLKETVARVYREDLDHVVSDIKNKGLQISTRILTGKPFIELIREVLQEKHDLVIMNSATEDGLKEVFFGSDAMHMMRKCPCPVWVMKPKQGRQFAKILATVESSLAYDEPDSVKAGLNKKIMEMSSSLARLEGSELHIVHAWDLYLEAMLRNRAGLSQQQIDDLNHITRSRHETMVYELVHRYSPGLPEKQIHILKGRAGHVIPEVARTLAIELIVMGTVSRTGIAGFFIGNTAEEILGRVDCSVLTVKPDGFVSPVKLQ